MGRALVRTFAALAVVTVVTFVGVVGLLLLASTQTDRSGDGGQRSTDCLPDITGLGGVRSLAADQLGHARTIIAVGRSMQVPDRGIVVALATAMQESTLRNLDHGDRDSVGLFQQRPSSGWGSVGELTTPATAARKFYAALLRVGGWEQMPVTVAAQTVQRSAFPLAYAKWEPLATSLVSAAGPAPDAASLGCSSSLGVGTPPGAIGDMLRIALGQQGKPYVWGATGPDAFDCSGLIVYAWRMAGYRSTVRTSEQMFAASDRVPMGQERPGDLLFMHFTGNGPGHVMIVVRPGLAVQAPRTGDVVKLTPYTQRAGFVVGRLRAGVVQKL